VDVSYNVYGTYTWADTDDGGDFRLHVPDGQAVAGAAFTDSSGELTAGGGGTQSATVEYETVTGMGMLPDMAMLDTQVSDSVKQSEHLILVGGPAVNTLVSDLASNGDTWTQQEWADQHDNEALLQHVENAFASGQHALIVAGHSSGDTRAAARYISNYADHEQALSQAGNQLVLTEADYPAN
jgi:ketol-acid reductoisomerase